MKFVIFTAVLITAQGASLLGQDKCTWGPSYWCSSLVAASQCQAYEHCLDTTWKNKVPDILQTEECLLSQKVIDSVRHVLSDVDSKEQASQLLFSLCPMVTEETMRRQCKVMVTDYFPEVFRIIETDIDSASVSAVLGFCEPMKDTGLSNSIPQAGPFYPPTNSSMCEDCRAFIGDVGSLLQQPGAEERFVSVMTNIICSELGDLADLCKAFLKIELPKLFKYMAENDNPETVCRLGTFCIDTVDEEKKKLQNVYSSVMDQLTSIFREIEPDIKTELMCLECHKMLMPVLTLEKESRFRVAVEHAIGYLCSETNIGEEKCTLMASNFIPSELGNMLAKNINVDHVCKSSLKCFEYQEVVFDQNHSPLERTINMIDSAGSSCQDCLHFFDDVRAVFLDNVTAPEAAAMAKQSLCQNFGALEYECNDFLDIFMPVFLRYLASVDSPQRVCSDLTMCTKHPVHSKFDIVKYFNQVWEGKKLKDFKCDECQTVVIEAREAIRNADFQNTIVNFFNNICSKLGKDSNMCKGLVQQYAPQLFEILVSEMEPEVLCDLLLGCSKPEIQKSSDEEPMTQESIDIDIQKSAEQPMGNSGLGEFTVKNGVECAICRLAMESIDDVIAANASQQEVEDGLKKVCNLLPSSVRVPCDNFINTYTPALVDLLLQELDPFLICNELRVCNDSAEQLAQLLQNAVKLQSAVNKDEADGKSVSDTIDCQLCELIVGYVDSFIGSNRTEAAIQKALDDVCDVIPAGMRAQCHLFVDEYSGVVVQLLLQELDPQQVCIFIGICTNGKENVKAKDGVLCSLCEIVIHEVDLIIGSNKTEPAIQQALDKVCSLFPITIRDECVQFVNTYAPAIINLLVQELAPQAICKALGLCQSTDVKLPVALPVPAELEEEDEVLCELCEAVVTQLDTLLSENKTEAAVEHAVGQVCTFFPPNKTAECVSIIQLYAPAIINLLAQEVRPKEVCKQLGLCTTERVDIDLPKTPEREVSPSADNDEIYCEMCKLIISKINEIIMENRTEAALMHAVEIVCEFLSGDLRLQCKSEVENYGPAVLDLLTHMDNPETICKAFKLCASPNNSDKSKAEVALTPGEKCIMCQTMANYAGEALKEEATSDEVVKLLQDLCTFLPPSLSQQCKQIVDELTPTILDELANKINPLQLCQDIGFCAKSILFEPTAVGTDPCTYGPTFWCASVDNARRCQMMEDCVEKYGMKP